MVEMRAAQDQELTSYGFIDRQKGIVHIPIEEAKKLALQRGFPSVGQTLLSVPAAQAGVPAPHAAGEAAP
jgi:hypothetical protein